MTLRTRASWVAEYYPVSEVSREADRVRVTLPVGSLEWVTGLLLRLGDDVVEVSDSEVARAASHAAKSALRAYRGDTAS